MKDNSKQTMIITCKKCQKKLQINEVDLRPGSVFTCPACGNTIRTKLAEPPQAQSNQWTVLVNGEPFGPYSIEQMIDFIGESRIVHETEVQHPRFTQGLWMKAKVVGPLRDRLGKADSSPIQGPPPVQSPLLTEPPIQASVKATVAGDSHTYWGPESWPKTRAFFKDRWAFPWVFSVIWISWLAVLPPFSIWRFTRFYQEFSNGDILTLNHQVVNGGAWFFGNVMLTAMFAVVIGVPAIIGSIIAYLFLPRPPSR